MLYLNLYLLENVYKFKYLLLFYKSTHYDSNDIMVLSICTDEYFLIYSDGYIFYMGKIDVPNFIEFDKNKVQTNNLKFLTTLNKENVKKSLERMEPTKFPLKSLFIK